MVPMTLPLNIKGYVWSTELQISNLITVNMILYQLLKIT